MTTVLDPLLSSRLDTMVTDYSRALQLAHGDRRRRRYERLDSFP